MHPAPSLAESFPKSTKPDERPQQHVSLQQQHDQSRSSSQTPRMAHLGRPEVPKIESQLEHPVSSSQSSPPMRKDTASSTSTIASDSTVVTTTSTDTTLTAYSVESSQSIFSVKDGAEISGSRRASRRRTGPLSAAQREKAALIRKLGACSDCRRRRVACHPNHHNMSWEEAVQKYRSSSPLQDLAPLAGRPISPAPIQTRPSYTHAPQQMEIDSAPAAPRSQAAQHRAPLAESRMSRTPLPSGPRVEKPLAMPPPLAAAPPMYSSPHFGSLRADLESTASRILSSPTRDRYTNVYVLLIQWEDDPDASISGLIETLAEIFQRSYRYVPEIIKIPSTASDGYTNPRALYRAINDFIDKSDTRETLKVVYYNGYSHLNDDREMVLARSRSQEKAGTLRWSIIQHILEEANSDTLLVMDSVYYPASKMVRQRGVLEVIAASASEEYFNLLGRGTFTRVLVDQLRSRATHQRVSNALSVVELHSKLLSIFPKLVLERHPEKEAALMMGFPAPLHMQTSGNARLPSITLSPQPNSAQPYTGDRPQPTAESTSVDGGPHVILSIRLTDESNLSLENWTEWFRLMPEGIREVKVGVEGPYNTFR